MQNEVLVGYPYGRYIEVQSLEHSRQNYEQYKFKMIPVTSEGMCMYPELRKEQQVK